MKTSDDSQITDLIHAVRLLVRRSRVAGTAEGLSWTEAAVLARLRKEGPSTAADLARAECMKPQSMGAKIIGLEQLKLVERKPHPEDGRQMIIVLTDKGKDIGKKVLEAQRAWFAETVDELSSSDRKKLFTATSIIRRISETST